MDKRVMPQEAEVREMVERLMSGLCTAIPGVIESFDASTCLATVQPAVRLKSVSFGGQSPTVTYLDLPPVERVPVVLPHSTGAGLFITVPIIEGDQCLLVFAQRSIDNVVGYGGVQNPAEPSDGVPAWFTELRHHDMTDAICIPSLMCAPHAIGGWSQDGIVIRNKADTVNLKVAADGVSVKGNLYVSGTVTAVTDVIGGGKSLATHTHPIPSGNTGTPN